MSRKSPPVNYITRKIRTMGRDEFLLWLQNSPLKSKDQLFMIDEKELTYKELAQKYNLTESGIYQRKRRLYEQLHRYEYCLMEK